MGTITGGFFTMQIPESRIPPRKDKNPCMVNKLTRRPLFWLRTSAQLYTDPNTQSSLGKGQGVSQI